MLSQKRLKEVLNYDLETGIFIWKMLSLKTYCIRVGDIAGGLEFQGYWRIKIDGKLYKAHRLAWLYMTGEWPNEQIDHINGIKDDNRWCNLRRVNNSKNEMNRGKTKKNTSGVKGVYWNKRDVQWQAQIGINGKKIFLGYFQTREQAYAAYCLAAKKYHGEFAHG